MVKNMSSDIDDRDPLWYLEEQEEPKKKPVKLEGKDYIAIFIASLETIFLPIVVLFVFMFLLAVIFALI